MLALTLFCVLLIITNCVCIHLWVKDEQHSNRLYRETIDLKDKLKDFEFYENFYKKTNKIVTCKGCGVRYDYSIDNCNQNFCSELCDKECEL